MKEYTPINEWKLSKTGRDIFKKCKEMLSHNYNRKILSYNVEKVHLNSQEFDELLIGISPSIREGYINSIPLDGKNVVRKLNSLK